MPHHDDLLEEVERWTLTLAHHVRRCPDELAIHIGPQSPERGDPVPTSKEVVIGDGPFRVRIRPTHRGRPVAVDGPVTVDVADPSLFDAVVQPDGETVVVTDRGTAGTTDLTFTADVKSGEGVLTQQTVLTLVAVPAEADTLELEVGEQEEPAPEPAPPGPEPAPPEPGPTPGPIPEPVDPNNPPAPVDPNVDPNNPPAPEVPV